MAPVLLSLLWLVFTLSPVSGFSFSTGQVGACDPLSLSWSGGLPPFQLLIIPPGGIMTNISIPASAYNDGSGQGSYTLPQLQLKAAQQVMLSMSDATGTFAGGTSSLLSVGASQSGQSCNTTSPSPDFTFSLDSSLAECSPFQVTLYPGAVTPALPVRLLVNIPQGYSFVVSLPLDVSSWIANVTAGTAAAFTVVDALNKNGGTGMLQVAEATSNTACLVSSFTSTTTPMTTPMTTPTTTGSTSPTGTTAASPQRTHNITTALAVGISVGGFGILSIVALIIFWCCRRRQVHAMRPKSSLDLSGDSAYADPSYHTINVYTGASNAQSHVRAGEEAMMSESSGSRSQPTLSIQPNTIRTAKSGNIELRPPDVVMHRDITETTSPQPVEVPPEYSASFPPIPSGLLHEHRM